MRTILLSGALSMAALAMPAAAAPAPDSGSVALRCGALIDGLSARATGPAVVVIEQGRITAVGPAARIPAGVRYPRPGRLHLPARPHRHAHAPDHAAGGVARPQRELPPDRPATGRHLTRARPPDAARGVHHGARRRQLYGVGRQGDTRRDQSRRDAGAAHAGRRHLPDDSRRRRGPRDSRASGVRDTCAGADGRCAWTGAVPPEGRAGGCGRSRSAEGDRFRSGVFLRRRHRATRR